MYITFYHKKNIKDIPDFSRALLHKINLH